MKVGLNQATRPTPLWFRRLRDAFTYFLLPALGQLITSLKLTDAAANMWLQVLTFLPALFGAVGVLLGEDPKKRMRVWLLLIGCGLLLGGCRSSAEIATAKARRQAVADSMARAERLRQLQAVRKELPCVPLTVIRGQTVYLPGDSIPCTPGMKCPPPGIRVDTLPYLDEAALQALRDSLVQTDYLLGLKDGYILDLQASAAGHASREQTAAEAVAKWRGRFWWLAGGILALIAGALLLTGKLSLFLKPVRWLISIWR